MAPLVTHPVWLLVTLALSGWLALRCAGLPRGLTLAERCTIVGLALWTVLLLDTLLVGALPGGFRPAPLALGMLGLTALGARWLPPGDSPGWWRELPAQLRNWERPTRLLWLGMLLALLLLSIQILRLPPTEVDSLGYHLLGPIGWVQAGQWHQVSTYWDWANSYPQNVEMLAGFFLAHLPDTRYGDAANPLFLALAFAAATTICRSLGASRIATGLALFGVLISPFLICYASATYTDIPLAACFLASLALFLAWRRTGETMPLWWAWIALCLAAGSKASGLVLLTALAIPGLVLLWNTNRSTFRPLRVGLWMGIPLLVLTIFWYVRSYLWYGSPVHPWSISIAGFDLFTGPAGPYAAHIESIEPLYVGTRHPYWLGLLRYFGHFGGELRVQLAWAREWFGPQTSILGTVALLWMAWQAFTHRHREWLLVLGLGLGLALLNPVPMVPRFAAHLPFIAAVASSLLLTLAERPLRAAAQIFLAGSLIVVLLVLPFSLLPIDDSIHLPDRYYPEFGPSYWWTTQLVQPGDSIVYVQPLRATGRMIPPDLSARLRYLPLESFSTVTALAPTGTTWLILADEERVTKTMDGLNRDAVEAQLRAQAPDLRLQYIASGTTFNLHNYRIYALRPLPGEAPDG